MRLRPALLLGLVVGPALLFIVLTGEAQQTGKVARIGYLSHSFGIGSNEEALRQGLRELGHIEGRNLVIEWRFAKGDLALHPKLAANLVRLNVDCIITVGIAPTRAAQQATGTIPIVMANSSDDPVRHGLAASLAQPGGNVMGFTDFASDLAGKRLELLMATVPKATRVAILWHAESPAATAQFKSTEAAARRLDVRLQPLGVRSPEDLKNALQAARAAGADALIVVSFGFVVNHKEQIAELAIRNRLPVISTVPSLAHAGSLMSYAPDLDDQYRRTARYIDKILKGAKPSDLPIEQPTKFELVINLKTAKALGLTIPPSVLLRADHIIE